MGNIYRYLNTLTVLKIITVFTFGVISASYLVHLNPHVPSAGLDSSWALGINTAVQHGMMIGKDIIFTYGPLAYIETPYLFPERYYFIIIINLFILSMIILLFSYVIRFNSTAIYILVVISIFLINISWNLYYFYCILYFCFALKVEKHNNPHTIIYILSTIVLAIMPIIKISYFIPSIYFLLLSSLYILLRRIYVIPIFSIIIYTISFLFFWILSSYTLDGIPAYLRMILPITSGYTEAMAVYGPLWHLALFGVSAVSIVLSVFWPLADRNGRSVSWHAVLCAGAVIVFFFFQFKLGFIRHDGHARIAAGSLLLAAIILPATRSAADRNPAFLFSLIALASVSAYLIDGSKSGYAPIERAQAALTPYSSLTSSIRTFPPSQKSLMERYEEALARIHKKDPLPQLSGTTDIYSFNQAALIASDNVWNPRPIFQSYAAYLPSLARLNRNHLLSENAPDNILFTLEPIDGRLPTLEDGLSWPAFMSHYRVTNFVGRYAYLRRRATPISDVMSEVERTEYRSLDEIFLLPSQKSSILFATLDFNPLCNPGY